MAGRPRKREPGEWKSWYWQNREKRLAYVNGRYYNEPGVKQAKIRYIREEYHRLRAKILAAYGPHCSCCGETEVLFLTIDHVNNDGKQHRVKHGNQANLYRSIVRAGFPSDYRILCFNCNSGRQLNGGRCPHKGGGITLGDESFDERSNLDPST